MVNTNNDEDDVGSDKLKNASVLVSTLPAQHVASTIPTDISQPMVLTTYDDIYQDFAEALLIPPDDTDSYKHQIYRRSL